MARLSRVGAGEATTCLRVGSSGNRCLAYTDPFGLCAAGSGGGGGQGGSGAGKDTTKSHRRTKTECEQLADRAGQIAAGSRSISDFAEKLGTQVAGVRNISTLTGGGTNVIPPTTGGYKEEFGGDASAQARHFAASVWTANAYGVSIAAAGFAYNELFRPGGNRQDWNLSVAAFGMYGRLGEGSLPLLGGSVRNYILKNICNTTGEN